MPTDGGSERIFELQEEIQQLKEAVVSHAVVDQAIGMVVVLGRISPDQGWAVLKEVSQHTNIKLRNVAELILIWGHQGRSSSSLSPPGAVPGPSRARNPAGQRGLVDAQVLGHLGVRLPCLCHDPYRRFK